MSMVQKVAKAAYMIQDRLFELWLALKAGALESKFRDCRERFEEERKSSRWHNKQTRMSEKREKARFSSKPHHSQTAPEKSTARQEHRDISAGWHSVQRQDEKVPGRAIHTKKVWNLFRLFQKRLWQSLRTNKEERSHTCIWWLSELTSHIQMMVYIVYPLFYWKLSDFFWQDSAKTLSSNYFVTPVKA